MGEKQLLGRYRKIHVKQKEYIYGGDMQHEDLLMPKGNIRVPLYGGEAKKLLRKRRKTLQIREYDDSKEDTKEKAMEKVVGDGRTSTSKKEWKNKVENLNMQIIENDSFVQLNK